MSDRILDFLVGAFLFAGTLCFLVLALGLGLAVTEGTGLTNINAKCCDTCTCGEK